MKARMQQKFGDVERVLGELGKMPLESFKEE